MAEPENQQLELHIYSRRVALALIFFGGLLFMGGLHFSGLDLRRLEGGSATYKTGKHVCVQWDRLESTREAAEPLEVCVEWIDLSDTSGETHHLDPENLKIAISPQGAIQISEKNRLNIPLLFSLLYLGVLVLLGRLIQVKLVRRRVMKMLGEKSTHGEKI